MTINATPRLGILLMASAMAQKETVFNEAVLAFDAMFSGTVLSMTLTTPPSSPSDGDCYIVPTGATGAWNGQTNKLAFAYNGWQFLNVPDHYRVYNVADSEFHLYSASSGWSVVAAGSPSVLTDLTDVSASSVTDGQLLAFNATTGKWEPLTLTMLQTLAAMTDVSVSGVASGQVLQYNGTKWVPFTLPAQITTLAALSDFDAASLQAGYVAIWNGTKLTFEAPSSVVSATIPTVEQLANFSAPSGGVTAGMALVYNGAVWTASASAIQFTFENMTDGPGTMVGAAGKILMVNATETALTYADPATTLGSQITVSDLADTAISSPANGQLMIYNSTTGKWANGTLPTGSVTITGLSDVQVTEGSAINGYVLYWNNTASSWQAEALAAVATTGSYTDLLNKPTIPTNASFTLSGLSDVNVAEGVSIDGYALVWSNTAGKWIASAVSSSGGSATLSGNADVSITSPANGDFLEYNSAAAKWENVAEPNIVRGTPSGAYYAAARYWRLSNMSSTGTNVSMSEVMFHSTVGGTELGIGSVVWTASTNYSGSETAANLGDGNMATDWSSTEAGSAGTAWVQADFGSAITPVEVAIYPRGGGYTDQTPSSFTLQYSNDGVTWTSCATFSGLSWSVDVIKTFTIPKVTGSGPASLNLSDLLDTSISSPSAKQFLTYNSATGLWTNQATTLAGNSDVSILSPTDGQVLTYILSSGAWEARTPSASAGTGGVANSWPETVNDATIGVPALSSFTKIGESASNVISQSASGLISIVNNGTPSFTLIGVRIAAPAPPYRVAMLATFTALNTQWAGISFGWSDGTKTQALRKQYLASGFTTNREQWSSATVRNSNTAITSAYLVGEQMGALWLGLRDDGTTAFWELSHDGVNWVTIYSVTKSSAYLGASGYSNIWFGIVPEGTSTVVAAVLRVYDINGLTRILQ